MGFAWQGGGIVACALALALLPSTAVASYDDLPGEPINGAPHSAASAFDQTASFDTSAFGEQAGELNSFTVYLGCGAWGARTGWVRFATAVAGNLRVTIGSGYDVFYKVYAAAGGNASFGDLAERGCHNGSVGVPNDDYIHGHEIQPGQVIYVQVLAVCANRVNAVYCDEDEYDTADGGPTTVRLRFTPANADGDGFADTLDSCLMLAGPLGGCPNRDGDGVADHLDGCPDVAGVDAIGCDQDGDGYRSRAAGGGDCADANAKIHPKARSVAGNGVDENCDGRDPSIVDNGVAKDYLRIRGGRYVGFASFTLLDVRKGMGVQIECRGTGCPRGVRRIAIKQRAKAKVVGRFLGESILGVGTTVTVKLTRPGYVGKAIRYRMRETGKPRQTTFCIPPGGFAPLKRKC